MQAHVTLGGFADKSTDEGLAKIDALFRASHFLLLPTQAEAFGIVFCEANSFGVPAVATRTGGVPSVVHDDVNGRLFTLDAPADAYADYIQHHVEHSAEYANLAQSSFREYRQRLNWHTNAGIVLKHLNAMLAERDGAAAPPSVMHDAHAGSAS
jgi:glycosyltransferase involved in cell wall biosynthesis